MPGRIVGRTVDLDGKPGFTLTLQAREQHIRRSRATSNICTNQGLIATAATIYMSLLGSCGLQQVARSCNANTHALVDCADEDTRCFQALCGAFFHEAVLQLDRPVADCAGRAVCARDTGWLRSVSEHYPELGNALLVCATENSRSGGYSQLCRSNRRRLWRQQHERAT